MTPEMRSLAANALKSALAWARAKSRGGKYEAKYEEVQALEEPMLRDLLLLDGLLIDEAIKASLPDVQ